MFRATSKNRLNISHKRMAIGLTLVVLVLYFVLAPLVHEHEYWVSRSSMFFAERMELPMHAPARTIVSISTFSQRVFNMRWCLDTVFAQSQLPDRIIISIPRKFRVLEPTTGTDAADYIRHNETELDIVAWFSEYTGVPPMYRVNMNVHKTSYVYDMGILTVQFLDDDPWGPATKLVGALLLEKDPETVIITLDDDMPYHRDTVQWLATHTQHGIALSFGCEMWLRDKSDFVDFTMWSINTCYMTTPRVCSGWLVGWTGVAYRVSSFGPDIYTFLQALPIGCFNNDDMWLSAYVGRQGITKIYAPMVMQHGEMHKNEELSLSTIVNYREKGYSCGRHLFP
jgi:hypothetical protein